MIKNKTEWDVIIQYNENKRRWDMFRILRGKQFFVMDYPPCQNFLRFFKGAILDSSKVFKFKLIGYNINEKI